MGARIATACIHLLLYITQPYKTHHYLLYIQIRGGEQKINKETPRHFYSDVCVSVHR